MIIQDIYGEEEITEPVLLELINSKEIQRLKHISQFGMPEKYYHKKVFSRYEHSIGVFILLRKLDANLEEQIAGLLHDVSHTAFSHVVDWVVGDPTKEDYQDTIHDKVIKNSEISKILEKHNFNPEKISDIESFSLLEQEAPEICADRFDYTVRELKYENKEDIAKICIDNIINKDGKMIFKTKEAAKLFAVNYTKMNKEHWAGIEARARYHLLAKILKEAIEKNIISLEDLNTTDEEVLKTLIKSNDKEILNQLNVLKSNLEFEETKEGIALAKKFRYVNPKFIKDNKIHLLTEESSEYKNILDNEKQDSTTPLYFRIVNQTPKNH